MEELSFSKINIGLSIVGKRADGYHNIDTIFQSIMLGDSIYFAKHHSVVFSGGAPELPDYMDDLITYDEDNLALRALRAVQSYTGCKTGAAIHLLKRVPPAAGLGGGSADAASMIKGLNAFWDLRLTHDEMISLAAPLGADVPFLLTGGTARGTGIGADLRYLDHIPETWLLLVRPNVSISTKSAYNAYTGHSLITSKTIDDVEQALHDNDVAKAFALSGNTFEELLFPVHEELSLCKEYFVQRGYEAILTGSGPTIAVHLPTAKDALHLQDEMKATGHDWFSLITKTKKGISID